MRSLIISPFPIETVGGRPLIMVDCSRKHAIRAGVRWMSKPAACFDTKELTAPSPRRVKFRITALAYCLGLDIFAPLGHFAKLKQPFLNSPRRSLVSLA